MEREPRVDINAIEQNTPTMKLSFQYKDAYGRLLGTFTAEQVDSLPDAPSKETTYFDGSVETPYGTYMLECKVAEAEKILTDIAEYLNLKEALKATEEQLDQSRKNLYAAQEKFRKGEGPDYTASRLVNDVQDRQSQLERRVKAHEERLKKYKV